MRIEKYIGLWLLAGLAAACQKEIVESAEAQYSTEAILFTTPYTVSKSAAMRDGDFKVGDEIGVLGYSEVIYEANGETVNASTADWNAKKEFATPDVFYNQKLEYAGNGTLNYTWQGTGSIANLHPWYDDPDYTYAFFAYYPYAEVERQNVGNNWNPEYIYKGTIAGNKGTITLSAENEPGDPTITYTMPYSTGNNNELDVDVVPDFMLAYTIDHRRGDGAVPLKFRHMLCAFEFEINNYTEREVIIDSLQFKGSDFYRSFSITGQEQDYVPNDNDRYSGYFDLLDAPITCPAASGNGEYSSVKVTANGEPIDLLFIPDKDGKITEGTCSVTVNMDGSSAESTQNLKEGMSFSPGTRSIFSINIIGDNFIIQVRTEDSWSDGGDSNIYFD